METQYSNLDEAISRMQLESKARGMLRLTEIYGGLYSRQEISSALEINSLNVEQAAIYLQDRLPLPEPSTQLIESESVSIDQINPEFQSIPQISNLAEEVFAQSSHKNISENMIELGPDQVQCPETGSLALEFSLSPQYVNCTIPVVYVSDEILKEIFSFFTSSERGRLASVCKTFKMIEKTAVYLYKRDSLAIWAKQSHPSTSSFPPPFNNPRVLWGLGFPESFQDSREYIQSFKGWRQMMVQRPKIRFNGVYISRVSFFKQGQINFDNLPSFHKVVFYRYLRFYNDFSVACLSTTKKPREVFRFIEKSYPDCRLGEWARKENNLKVHLWGKTEVFTYEIDVRSTSDYLFDLLKLKKVMSRKPGDLDYYELNINNEAWPRYFKYYPYSYNGR